MISQKHTYEGIKAFLEGRKLGLFVNIGQYSWVRIRILNTDPDPGQPNQFESGSTTVKSAVKYVKYRRC
jgi:hypothetical protein